MTNGRRLSDEAVALVEGDRDWPYLVTLDEVLLTAMDCLEKVRHAETALAQGVYLKMASRAVRCALEMYGSQFGGAQPQEEK